MQVLTLTLFIFFVTPSAFATTKKSTAPKKTSTFTLKTIRSYESFSKLTPANKELYLYGLQALMQDLDAEDASENTEYQSAQFKFNFLDVIASVGVPFADAAGGDRRCVYAGSVSEMDVNGRFCLRPRDTGKCSPKITCNPLIYGEGKCAPSGKLATSTCQRGAKPFAQIAKELANKKDEWTAFQSELGGYCASPRPTQKTVCGIIERRVAQIESVVGKSLASRVETTPAAEPAAEAPVEETPVTAAAVEQPASPEADAIPVVRARAASAVAQPATIAAPPPPPPLPAQGVAAAATGADSKCVSAALIAPMNGEGEPKEGFNLMTLWEAQQLMCYREGISDAFITEIRRALAYRIAAVNRMPAKSRTYYRESFTRLSKNFEACLNEANKIRAGGPINSGGRGATLKFNGSVVSVIPTDGLEGPNLAALNEQSISLGMYGFQVCKLKSDVADRAKADRSSRAFGTSGSAR